MITSNDLVPLYNTLSKIYVNGQNAMIMGDCLRYLQQLIDRSEAAPEREVKDGEH